MATSSIWDKGFKLGMWGKDGSSVQPDLTRTTPAPFTPPEGVDPNLAYTLQMLRGNAGQDLETQKQAADYMFNKQLEMAKERQKLGEESTQKALMYTQLAKIPESIALAASPYGGALGAEIAFQGYGRIPDVYRSTFASVPSMNLQAPGYSAQQVRYFS